MAHSNKIQLYNTLSGRKEEFHPIDDGKVKMYVCGITPYDECHLGHARCYVFFDTVRRFLKSSGFDVTYVQNFTDIDDKIIARANALQIYWDRVTQRFIHDYFEKMELLNIQQADFAPKVTETIPEIIAFVQKLIENDFAYVLDGDVYYSVRKFNAYGRLSKRALNEMEAGARVAVDERKKDPLDFALWKKAKPGEPSWASPWGAGRPGWHIECSVMSIKYLGESFDIHGGGQDLIFPHHENEIAQSEAATGAPFVRYWIHNGFVTLNKEKMSKSLGNFFSLREILQKFSPEVVRFFLLSRHYRSPLDFSDDLLIQARNAYSALQVANDLCFYLLADFNESDSENILEDWKSDFFSALSDDFNTEKAISVVFQLRREITERAAPNNLTWLSQARATINYLCTEILGVKLQSRLDSELLPKLKKRLAERDQYRAKKEWEKADQIREEMERAGFLVEDTPFGSVVKTNR